MSKLTTKKTHQEQLDGEVFITNAAAWQVMQIGWKTKRTGKVAYAQDGTVIENMVPVFAKATEIHQAGIKLADD